jgi:hypothetical protein
MLFFSFAFFGAALAKLIVIDKQIPFENYEAACKRRNAVPFEAKEEELEKILGGLDGAESSSLGWVGSYNGVELKNVGVAIGRSKEGVPILEITDSRDDRARNVSLCVRDPKKSKGSSKDGDKKKTRRSSHKRHDKASSDSETASSDESSTSSSDEYHRKKHSSSRKKH